MTIWGKVTASNDTGDYATAYFYVDDGSKLYDGANSANIGIECAAPPDEYGNAQSPLPTVGEYVSVTGIMGAEITYDENNNPLNNARYLRTLSWQLY